jgi:hypothetical protein
LAAEPGQQEKEKERPNQRRQRRGEVVHRARWRRRGQP